MTVVKVTNVQYILKKPTLKNSGFFQVGPPEKTRVGFFGLGPLWRTLVPTQVMEVKK